jgi:hypothetical protein
MGELQFGLCTIYRDNNAEGRLKYNNSNAAALDEASEGDDTNPGLSPTTFNLSYTRLKFA